jgi:hypothetical protein
MRFNPPVILGLLWVLAMLCGALSMPYEGSWTIDDGIKEIGARFGTGLWAESIPDGNVRSQLADPATFPPLDPPFAARSEHGFNLGFSPWTRAFFKLVALGGYWMWRLVPALIAVALWVVLMRRGMYWSFLLLPLTFYGLVPWEHALSWLLLWPAVWIAVGEDFRKPPSQGSVAMAGFLLALAILLRSETAILAVALVGYLVVTKSYRRAAALSIGAIIGLAVMFGFHRLTSSASALTQIHLNLIGPSERGGIGAWLSERPQAAWELLLQSDPQPWGAVVSLIVFAGGVAVLVRAEKRKSKTALSLAVMILAVWLLLFQSSLWKSHLVPLALLGMNSLVACLPWVTVLVFPPYRHRPAFLLAAISIVAAILLTPIWQGVHWGPRILLFAVPLLVVDLYQSGRARGWIFTVLLVLTAAQTASSAILVYARMSETSDRVRLAKPHLGTPAICPNMSQCVDFAPLWGDHEFFTTISPTELRQLLIQFRSQGLDTVWLHLDAFDTLYVKTFPDAKPVKPVSMTVLRAGSVYQTLWRIYALALNRTDTTWAAVLELEAGRLYRAREPFKALAVQRQAVAASPHSAQVRSNLALVLMMLKEDREARLQADTALQFDSTLMEPQKILEILESRSEDEP